MEIELPDGTVLEAPDDADVKAVVKGYRRQQGIARLKTEQPAEYDANSEAFHQKNAAVDFINAPLNRRGPTLNDQGKLASTDAEVAAARAKPQPTLNMVDPTLTNEMAGIGSGMERGIKGTVNLATSIGLPAIMAKIRGKSLTPDWASDKNIQEMDKQDEDLPTSGKLIGGVAATYPLSGGVGAAQRGVTALSSASRLPAVLTRALASAPTRAALEGATQGAVFGDPEHQGVGAVEGAAVGLGLNRLGATVGRGVRGLVEKSNAAKDLEHVVGQHGDDIFIPLGQAADKNGGMLTKAIRTIYREGMPYMPFAAGKLENQLETAQSKLRETALKEALPKGGTLIPEAGTKVEEAVANINDQFKTAYDATIKKYSFQIPKDIEQQMEDRIRNSPGKFSQVNATTTKELTDRATALFKKFADKNGVLDGENLVKMKEEVSAAMRGMSRNEKAAFGEVDKYLDEMVNRDLSAGNVPSNLADLARYEELTPAWRAFVPVQKAAKAAADNEGQFLFRTLAKRAAKSPEQRVIGQLGRQVLEQPATRGTTMGRTLVGLSLGGAMKYVPKLAITAFALGQGLGAKSTQKALMGDTAMQQKLAQLLRNHPEAMAKLGAAGRAATVQATQE